MLDGMIQVTLSIKSVKGVQANRKETRNHSHFEQSVKTFGIPTSPSVILLGYGSVSEFPFIPNPMLHNLDTQKSSMNLTWFVGSTVELDSVNNNIALTRPSV
jgi:hypothetical protein